ncbi:alpha/beta hydrolase family protein [Sphingobium nicotianae]|uniref:Alpha/beta hydrolase n=1 Tax=Sphingobium nicotianae TaxID=2782607 RepID=A0A9X1IPT4_9SPHN|nr:lipase family protein [Sphingobium nicotianae]MBT2186060.1 alpha/beta hydrolase [Sphingobium nicotianae]
MQIFDRYKFIVGFASVVGFMSSAIAGDVDAFFGDGGTSDFYRWHEALKEPGQMLRQEAVGDGYFADNASLARRILYSSTDGRFGRGVVEASGLLYLPKGSPPPGGWPLVVWGHGTLGVADVCAPSWKKPTDRDGAFADAWLQAGFAVVAPDYQGLGTRGVHPYLQRRPEGYSVLDAARAALRAYPQEIANAVVLVGQSQGSGAVLNAAAVAQAYAPELGLRGVVATALVWSAPGPIKVRDFSGPYAAMYPIMYAASGALKPGSPSVEALVTAKGKLVVEAARTICSDDVANVTEKNGVTGTNGFTVPLTKLAAMFPDASAAPQNLRVPLFIATGLADSTIPPDSQFKAVKYMCGFGNRISWKKYAGITHYATPNYALRDALPFAKAVLNGGSPRSDCGDLLPPGPLQQPTPGIPFQD